MTTIILTKSKVAIRTSVDELIDITGNFDIDNFILNIFGFVRLDAKIFQRKLKKKTPE